jgi:ribonuclease HI
MEKEMDDGAPGHWPAPLYNQDSILGSFLSPQAQFCKINHVQKTRNSGCLLLSWNAGSLNSKLPELSDFLAQHHPHVMSIQEHRLDFTPTFPGYHWLSSSPYVALLIRDDVSFENRHLDLDFDYKAIQVGSSTIIGSYVNPTSPSSVFSKLKSLPSQSVLLGDFNSRSFAFGLLNGQVPTLLGSALDRFLASSPRFRAHAPSSFTFKSGRYESILDGFISSDKMWPKNLDLTHAFGTQHACIGAEFCIPGLTLDPKNSKRKKPCSESKIIIRTEYDKFDHQFLSEISSENCVEWFREAVALEEKCKSPLEIKIHGSSHSQSAWWNNTCRKAIQARNRAWRILNNNKSFKLDQILRAQHALLKTAAKRAIADAKALWTALTMEMHSQDIWTGFHKLQGWKGKTFQPSHTPEQAATRVENIAKLFSSVAPDVPQLSPFPIPPRKTSILLERWEIASSIDSLKRKSSKGPDMVSPNLLKFLWHSSHQLTLWKLFNLIANNIPDEYRTALTKPIPKPSGGWRPIALLSQVMKVVERALARRLRHYNFPNQYCRSGASTSHAVMRLQHLAVKYQDGGIFLFTDISKAYDRVPLKLLIDKINKLNIADELKEFLSDWLHSRSFKVIQDGAVSSAQTIYVGIPQGSPLSPFLWKAFFSDLPCDSRDLLYMDDVCLVACSIAGIRKKVAALEKWAAANFVRFDEKKTRIFFASPTEGLDADLTLQNFTIQGTETYKYLGIYLGPIGPRGFSLSAHMHAETLEINKRIKMVAALAKHCDLNRSRQIFLAIVRSKMEYCLIIKKDHLHTLEKLQSKGLSMLTGSSLKHSILANRFCKIPPMEDYYRQVCMRSRASIIGLNNRIEKDLQSDFSQEEIFLYSPLSWLAQNSGLPQYDGLHLRPLDFGSRSSSILSYYLDQLPWTYSSSTVAVDTAHYFCDGGFKDRVGSYGIAEYISPEGSREIKSLQPLRTHQRAFMPCLSAYEAECWAFLVSLKQCERLPSTIKFVHIFTDSMSLLDKLRHVWVQNSPQSGIIIEILETMFQLFHEQDILVRPFWVPGHSGNIGNEKADHLAQQGLLLPPGKHPLGAEAWKFYGKLEGQMERDPDFPLSYSAVAGQGARMRRCTFGILTGIYDVKRYLAYKFYGDKSCRFCAHTVETVDHLLFYCRHEKPLIAREKTRMHEFTAADKFNPSLWPEAFKMLRLLQIH